MIEKVVKRIDELDQPHLKLVIMHDFMWALMEEWASNRAHAHQISNEDSGCDVWVVDTEAHDISQGVIDRALRPDRPMICEYMRDKPLTVNVLWEIGYGIHQESLCLDSLEDFNATEADIMRMKDDILATWKSRDVRKISSLRPTFISSADSRSQGSTLGKTFIPGGPVPPSGVLHCPGGGGMSAVSLSVFKPLAPPPGIPLVPRLSHYLQEPLPTSFSVMGPPVEYNFDPITGWPLKASTPDIFSQSSQLQDVLLPTSLSPHVTGLLNLPRLNQEERPLVVGPPSRSSRVVVGRRVPTVTVSSSAAERTLSPSPNTAPRISTSSSNVTGEDTYRVIWQHSTSSPSRVLAGAVVGRGSTRRPTKQSTGRGQGLASMLVDRGGNGAGRGRFIPSPPVGRPEQGRRQGGTHTESSLCPAVMMQLNHQGPAVTYSEAASRPPQRTVVSPSELAQCDVQLKVAAHKKREGGCPSHPGVNTEARTRRRGCPQEMGRAGAL